MQPLFKYFFIFNYFYFFVFCFLIFSWIEIRIFNIFINHLSLCFMLLCFVFILFLFSHNNWNFLHLAYPSITSQRLPLPAITRRTLISPTTATDGSQPSLDISTRHPPATVTNPVRYHLGNHQPKKASLAAH